MSAWKPRVVAAVLGWVALWPLAHRAAVAAFELNAWKLGGFAMYATAVPPVQVVLFEAAGGALRPVDEGRLPAELRRELAAFRVRRHALGRLASPDGLGRRALAAMPEQHHLLIAIQRLSLDPRTDTMQSTRSQHVYEREAPGGSRPVGG